MVKRLKKYKQYRRPGLHNTSVLDLLNFYCFSNIKWAICIAILLTCFIFIFDYGRTFNGSKQIVFFIVLCIAITIRIVIFELFLILLKTAYFALTSRKFPEDNYRAIKQKDLSNLERIEYHLHYLHDKLSVKNKSPFAPIIYERRTFFYNRLIYEIFLISIPTITLAVLLVNAKSKESYYAKRVIANLISYESLRNFSSRTKFSAITNDVYNYLNHTALPALHGVLNYDGKNHKQGWVRDGAGKTQGKIRLRQQRHKPIPGCPIPVEDRHTISYNFKCAKFYDLLEWDTKNYSQYWQKYKVDSLNDSFVGEIPILKEPFIFRPASETQAVPIVTVRQVYDASGYTVGLGRTLGNSQSILGYLRASNWIDNQTMVVFLEFNILNINSNFLLVNTVVIENFLAGEVETYLLTRIIRLGILARNIGWSILIWLLLCFCTIIWYIFYLFKRMLVTSFWKFFGNVWNVFDLVIVSLIFTMSIVFFKRDSHITKTLDDYENIHHFTYLPYHKLAEYEVTLFLIAGVCIFLSIIRLWRALQFSLMFRIFTMTIEKAKWALFNTALNIIIFSIAFTLVIGLLTGSDVELFHDIIRGVPAILSSTYVINGQNRLQDAFYSALLGVTTIYFVNMFIVCLLFYFDAAKSEISYEKEYVKYSFWRFVKIELLESFRSCMNGIWTSTLFTSNITKTRLSRLRGGGQHFSTLRDWTQKRSYKKGKIQIINNQFRNPTVEKYNISEQILDTQFLYLKTYIDDEMIDCHIGADQFLEFFQQTVGNAVVRDDPVELEEYYIPELHGTEPC